MSPTSIGVCMALILLWLTVAYGLAALDKRFRRPSLGRVWGEHVYFTAMQARARLRTADGRMSHRELIALCRQVAALLSTVENPPE